MKPQVPSEQLARIVGSESLPRTEATKRIWEYIKLHKLQDPNERRYINADATLAAVLKKDRVHQTELPGLLTPHLK